MSGTDQTFAGMIARWRKYAKEARHVTDTDSFGDCAGEAQALLDRLRGLVRRARNDELYANEMADALDAILGEQAPERTS